MRSDKQRQRTMRRLLRELKGWDVNHPGAMVQVKGSGIFQDDNECPDGLGIDLLNGETKLRLFFKIEDCLLLEAIVAQARRDHPVFFN